MNLFFWRKPNNYYAACMKAADHIERNPSAYDFRSNLNPSSGGPGCMIACCFYLAAVVILVVGMMTACTDATSKVVYRCVNGSLYVRWSRDRPFELLDAAPAHAGITAKPCVPDTVP